MNMDGSKILKSVKISIALSTVRDAARPATIFFIKKPKIFENVKSERAAANFQKSRTLRGSTIISKNSQI